MQIGPVDHEIALVKFKNRKKLRKVKYIARSASLPSGLNNLSKLNYHTAHIAGYTYRLYYGRHIMISIFLHRNTCQGCAAFIS